MPDKSDRIPATLRQKVSTRANGICEYCRCQEEFSPDSFTVEHINPRQMGGETVPDNLAWACFGCNGRKHTKVAFPNPETGMAVSLFNPRQQLWSEHFGWSKDYTEVIGKTPCGRATIEALKLNRLGVVNLRRLLVSVELHPPT